MALSLTIANDSGSVNMTELPKIHLCIMQPKGYVHSLGFLDQARYFRHQFRRMGAEVSIGKNRLMYDAVNFVFGAHLGFESSLRQRYSCIFVNLEQLGAGGAAVSGDYLSLLRSSAVVEYDADNIPAYAPQPDEVMVAPFLYAPYLRPVEPLPLEDRPIDLLFIGSMNDRRREMIRRIESTGVQVSLFDGPLYGPERDAYIAQAKAVFNAHFYETSRFEQARASHCLSMGTPVISERRAQTRPHAAFEDSVLWIQGDALEAYFSQQFKTPAFYEAARQALKNFESADPIEDYADLLAFAAGFDQVHRQHRSQGPWQPDRVHIGSGLDYLPGWLNIDTHADARPDFLGDLSQPLTLPFVGESEQAGPVAIEPGSVAVLYASKAVAEATDLPLFLTQSLALLAPRGKLIVQVPHERASSAWQGAHPRRAFNEATWLNVCEKFWELGWFAYRFELAQLAHLNDQHAPCDPASASHMRVVLVKVETSGQERMLARTMMAGFGELPGDEAIGQGAPQACLVSAHAA